MSINVNNPYFRTKVMTASQEELRLMLLDGCLRFLNQGRDGLVQKNYEQVYDGFTQARAIIMELIGGLRPEHDPQLCKNLEQLYTYTIIRLAEGSFRKDIAIVDEVIGLIEYERETWVLLMEQLERERDGEPVTPTTRAPGQALKATGTTGPLPAPAPNDDAGYTPLSIEG